MVEPRTVRAYCTQPDCPMEIDKISTPMASSWLASGNTARPTPAISSATRMGGNEDITSQTRIRARVDPAAAKTREQAQRDTGQHGQDDGGQTHHQRNARAVHQRRQDVAPLVVGAQQVFGTALRIQAGGRRASLSSSVLRLNGSCGATQPANTEQKMQTSAMAAATIATGEVRKLWPTSLSKPARKSFFHQGKCGSQCCQKMSKAKPVPATARNRLCRAAAVVP